MQINVAKQPVDPGPAAWREFLDAPEAFPSLDRKITADWLVVGAGFAGLSAARRLSQTGPGDRIVVLDATRVAEGPAGRNSGFMIDLPHDLASSDYSGGVEHDKAITSDNRFAIDFAAEMAAEFGFGEDVFSRCGKINGAATAKGHQHNVEYAKHLAAIGEPTEMMDAKAMEEVTGMSYYHSGLFTKGTAIIQPAAFVHGVAKGISSNRVQIFEGSGVRSLRRDGDWVAETTNGSVTAPKVILAVNGHLNSFGFLPNRLMHVFTYASVTRRLTLDEVAVLGGQAPWGITPADPLGTTVRRLSGPMGDRILIRNRFTFDPTMEVDQRRIERIGKDHDRAFAARFPMLKGVPMEYRWGGRLCLSRNNVGVVGELEDGLYCACCQNGLGTTRGTLGGIMAADLATGRGSERLDRALAAEAPSRLPPKPIATSGARAVLKWQEWKAGAEL
ncbi:Glycine/D-amino acid oxidase [Cognatiyoonia sediminum]|uniref:Glycine/D-amino acid oxidase n=1 Tax=Cognatiyoonia sediminum TaxID=1508389 RepID=A0A1M5T3S8_9RHOB|nr:FAD-binding oxidoreductase [Cognatiyoonia sediminum]SHH45419.1 Glycine/D-amino acid oxidase [Cognatiyoonia sediminum]